MHEMLKEFVKKKPNFALESKMDELVEQRKDETGKDEESAHSALAEDEAANLEVKQAGNISDE
eukprot:5603438-Prymnesium_polylepis.4